MCLLDLIARLFKDLLLNASILNMINLSSLTGYVPQAFKAVLN